MIFSPLQFLNFILSFTYPETMKEKLVSSYLHNHYQIKQENHIIDDIYQLLCVYIGKNSICEICFLFVYSEHGSNLCFFLYEYRIIIIAMEIKISGKENQLRS